MSAALALGGRALREAVRSPDAMIPTLFIPIFFLVVNTGQTADIFPSGSTDFLKGQGYGAFQLPTTLLLAASSAPPHCSWSRRSRAATSTSCAPRRSRARRS
jgi:ABC-2 type transport system permease protein